MTTNHKRVIAALSVPADADPRDLATQLDLEMPGADPTVWEWSGRHHWHLLARTTGTCGRAAA